MRFTFFRPRWFSDAAFDKTKHPRGGQKNKGQFAKKGAAAAPAPAAAPAKASSKPKALTVGAQHLKNSGVGGSDAIVVLSSRVRKYKGHATVESFVAQHPKGRAHALRVLAADHKAGLIGFGQGSQPTPAAQAKPDAPSKYDINNFSDFSQTDDHTVREVERDLYKQMLPEPETAPEIQAINAYSGSAFKAINTYLRQNAEAKDGGKPYDQPYIGEKMKNIDAVMKRSRMTEDTIVYRGMTGAIAKQIRQAKPGSIVRDAGYTSTSLYSSVANGSFGYDGVVMKLLLPKGNSAYIMNGRGASLFPGEHEVLLPRGSRFKIRKVEGNVVTAEVL